MAQELSFEKVWLMFQETSQQFKETDRKFQVMSQATDKKFQETSQQFKETDKKFQVMSQATDKKFQKLDKYIKELSKNLGGIGNSNGHYAEEFFTSSLEQKMKLLDTELEVIETNKNKHIKRLGIKEEYDIVLTNGYIKVIVEVKYRFKKEHLEKLLEQKLPNYRLLFPEDSGYNLRVGVAALSWESGVKEAALSAGCYVLSQVSDDIVVEVGEELKAY